MIGARHGFERGKRQTRVLCTCECRIDTQYNRISAAEGAYFRQRPLRQRSVSKCDRKNPPKESSDSKHGRINDKTRPVW